MINYLNKKEKRCNESRKDKIKLHQENKNVGYYYICILITSIFRVNDNVFSDIDALDQNQQELIQASQHQTKFYVDSV